MGQSGGWRGAAQGCVSGDRAAARCGELRVTARVGERGAWRRGLRAGPRAGTWVAHLTQAGMRSTVSPYAVSTRTFTFVLRAPRLPCQG